MNEPASDPAAAARGSLKSRVAVATAVIAAFTGLVWADAVGLGGGPPVWWLLPLAVVVAARGAAEFAGLFAAAGVPVRGPLVQFLTVAVAVSAAVGQQAAAAIGPLAPRAATLGWTAVALMAAVIVVLAAEVVRYDRGRRALEAAAAGLLVVVWLGLPLAFMVALRLVCVEHLGPEDRGPGHLGIVPLVSLIAVVKAGDIVAYLVGSQVGRTKLAPALSPGKTWEGAAAGIAASLAAAWLVIEHGGLAPAARPWGGWPLYGLAVAAAGMLGDLAESLAKRELGAKDSGRVLGGLGGVLDLVDSLLLAAPVAWILWVLGF